MRYRSADGDQIVPVQASAYRAVRLLPNASLKVHPGAPHGLTGQFEQDFNTELLEFILSALPLGIAGPDGVWQTVRTQVQAPRLARRNAVRHQQGAAAHPGPGKTRGQDGTAC